MGRIFIRPHEKWRRRKEICADQQCARCAFCAAGKKDASARVRAVSLLLQPDEESRPEEKEELLEREKEQEHEMRRMGAVRKTKRSPPSCAAVSCCDIMGTKS